MTETHDKEPVAEVAALVRELRQMSAPSVPSCAHAAIVIDAGGHSHRGLSVRSTTPGLGACALRVALARARAVGGSAALVVVLSDTDSPELCGLCRQSLMELAPSARVFVAGRSGDAREVDGLLPNAFGPDAFEGER